MRIAHITDIHWMRPPRFSQLTFKRTLGAANLFLAGRSHHFSDPVRQALVQHLLDEAPDLVVCSGDLTATATPDEFEMARTALAPVLDAMPFFTVPGNHDSYTQESVKAQRMRTFFGPWMGDGDYPIRFDQGPVTLLALDPTRPTFVEASTTLPQAQLDGLAQHLASPDLADRVVFVLVHYPVISRDGGLYDGYNHGLRNAGQVVEVLRQAPTRPFAILSGHVHHGYRAELALDDDVVLQLDPGSSGYAFLPEKRRAAALNFYTVRDGQVTIERHRYDGTGFAPEEGGAYATGR